MKNKRLKWLIYLAAPIAVLLIPFSGLFDLGRYFKSITLQPKKTGITSFQYYDESRSRPLVTEVWYPIDEHIPAKTPTGFWMRCDEARDAPISMKKQQYPLIVMSHGSGGDRFNIAWLAEVLAANGYIVAAMDHYGNTWNNKIPEFYARPWERPQDISFVLDRLLENPLFKDRIDTKRIGFAGYSLGGATGIWVAGAEVGEVDPSYIKEMCADDLADILPEDALDKVDFSGAAGSFYDPRIQAMVVMAPALGWLFEEKSLEAIDIPILIYAPEKDEVVPIEKNAHVFAKKITRSSLKVLHGDANHYVFLSRATAVGKRMLNPKYCEDPASIDRKKIHDEISKNALDFFGNHLR